MAEYRYYLTPTDYALALSNGIKGQVLDNRVREHGWDIKRACTEPLHRQGLKEILTDEVIKILKERNIALKTFRARILRLGWSVDKALNTPTLTTQESISLAVAKIRRISAEQYEVAKDNGIKFTTLQSRVKRGWSVEKSITTKTLTRAECNQLSYFYKSRDMFFNHKQGDTRYKAH